MKANRGAAFLDRDGTLIMDSGYMAAGSRIKFMPGVIEGLSRLVQSKIDLIIVSNQSGVARGLITVDDVDYIEREMQAKLLPQGITFRKSYYCFHLPSEGCNCRKPNSGMILKAINDFSYSPEKCSMFGDKETDILASEAAGIRGFLIQEGDFLDSVNIWLKTFQ